MRQTTRTTLGMFGDYETVYFPTDSHLVHTVGDLL